MQRELLQRQIKAGKLPALDLSEPGSKRPTWSIAVADLRKLIIRLQIRGKQRAANANSATEP